MQRAPMYRVIYDDIASQIHSGELKVGDRTPSEQEIASRFGVSRMTVRQAMDLLTAEGLVRRMRGRGTFVREAGRRGRRLTTLSSFVEELAESPKHVDSVHVRAELVEAPEEVAHALRLQVGATVNRLTRVRSVEGRPAALQDAWVPYPVAPSLVREDLLNGSLYQTLAERYGVELQWADQTMTAAVLGLEEAELLGVSAGDPALFGRRTTYSRQDVPVEFTYGWTLPEYPLLLRIEAQP